MINKRVIHKQIDVLPLPRAAKEWLRRIVCFDNNLPVPLDGILYAGSCDRETIIRSLISLGYPEKKARKRMQVVDADRQYERSRQVSAFRRIRPFGWGK